MDVRFCWHYEPFPFFSLKDSPDCNAPELELALVPKRKAACPSLCVTTIMCMFMCMCFLHLGLRGGGGGLWMFVCLCCVATQCDPPHTPGTAIQITFVHFRLYHTDWVYHSSCVLIDTWNIGWNCLGGGIQYL